MTTTEAAPVAHAAAIAAQLQGAARARQQADTCVCTTNLGGFTNAGTTAAPRWVHGACGKPSAGYAANTRTLEVVTPAGPGEPVAAVGDRGTVTVRPPADSPARTPLRILVTGSRDWTDRAAVEAALVAAAGTAGDVVLVHGDARGADTLAADIGRARGWTVEPHPADWSGAGRGAGPQRNARMVAAGADVCVAFPIGESRGTRDCMGCRAEDAGIPVRVIDALPADLIVQGVIRPASDSVTKVVAPGIHIGVPTAPTPENPRGYSPQMLAEINEWVTTPPTSTTSQRAAETDVPHAAEQHAVEHMAAAGAHLPAQPAAELEPAPEDPRRVLVDLTPWAGEATARGTNPDTVKAELLDVFREGILAGDIRGRQKEIGPSGIGHPCARSIAYLLAGVPHTGSQRTPWRQWVGTQVHTGTELHAHQANERRGTRWLTDLYVEVGELYPGRPIRGHLDFLDLLTATIVDLKVPGSTAMKTYAPGKPEAPQYRVQGHAYGRGVARAGFLPEYVATLRLSPARELHEGIFKYERYDEQVAVDALTRVGGIARMVDAIGPAAAEALPPTDFNCHRCDWYAPGSTDLTRGCPGAPGAVKARRDQLDTLVG